MGVPFPSFYSVLASSVISTLLTFIISLSFTLGVLYCICRYWTCVKRTDNNSEDIHQSPSTTPSNAPSAESLFKNPKLNGSEYSLSTIKEDDSMSMSFNPAYYKMKYFGDRLVEPTIRSAPLPPLPPVVRVLPPTPPHFTRSQQSGSNNRMVHGSQSGVDNGLYDELRDHTISERDRINNNVKNTGGDSEVTYLTILA
uniref:Uncharacterized protein n=1 Tax=Amphimedon queenslandica TaxID=400682 RepID=A0A1X7UHW8_AMPQE